MAGNRCGTWIICARTCTKRAYPSEFGGSRPQGFPRHSEALTAWRSRVRVCHLGRLRGNEGKFVHRLGHSLGRTVHSNAVNLDDWETHDTRTLSPGLGVTVEPGIYVGDFGVRSEIDLYIGETGPEITTDPQTEIYLIDV